MNDRPTRIDALIGQLYRLKEELAEARYQPDREYENRLDERFENLLHDSKDAGGTVPDALI
jgi:hypothetical protein